MTAIVPIAEMSTGMQTQGRIRLGKQVASKGERPRPTKADAFIFSSQDKGAIEAIAERYGGTPELWAGAPNPNTWRVETKAREVPIALPPDPLGGGPWMECWNRGGCLRRCDGVVCVVQRETPDGHEPVEVPCVCKVEMETPGFEVCRVTTRLSVVLTEIPFGGSWRLDTKSKYVAREMPGMVAMIATLQGRGLVRATLALEQVSDTRNGKTFKFNKPVLRLKDSPDDIVGGMAALGSAAEQHRPALGPAVPPSDARMAAEAEDQQRTWFDTDAEVVDAELVDENENLVDELCNDLGVSDTQLLDVQRQAQGASDEVLRLLRGVRDGHAKLSQTGGTWHVVRK